MPDVEPPELTEARERLSKALDFLETLTKWAQADTRFESARQRADSEAADAARAYVMARRIPG